MLPWALLVVGSAASLAANVAVAQPTTAGRVIAAWPSFALIGAYELLMREVRHSAAASGKPQQRKGRARIPRSDAGDQAIPPPLHRPAEAGRRDEGSTGRDSVRRNLQRQAWEWALAHRAGDGSLPSGREIARQYGRHERWGCLVKRAGAAGEFGAGSESSEPGLRLVQPGFPSATAE